jgi:hypothetical protein
MTEQNKAKYQPHTADDGIGERICICEGSTVVKVAHESVANRSTGNRQGQGEDLEKKICLLRALIGGGGTRTEAVCIVAGKKTDQDWLQ